MEEAVPADGRPRVVRTGTGRARLLLAATLFAHGPGSV